MPRAAWVAAVALLTAGVLNPAAAQPLAPSAPVGGPPPPPLGSTPVTPTRNLDRPPPVLGSPVSVEDVAPRAVAPAGFTAPPAGTPLQRAAAFGAPSAAGSDGVDPPAPVAPVPAARVDGTRAKTAYQPPAADPVNEFLFKRSDLKDRDGRAAGKSASGTDDPLAARKFDVGEQFDKAFGARGDWFKSDHCLDSFISPVSNPFLFEDPRSLTEVRPIFIYQGVPSKQPDFGGGHTTFFGTQARLAFTDRWSLVLNKFGGDTINGKNDPSPFHNQTGFAEIWLSPKYTFYRDVDAGTIAAGGLQFQIPVGSKSTYQNTGTLSLVPYVSYAQNFLRDFRLGSFNVMATTGYSFSVNRDRSDYYYLSGHLDFDVAGLHRFYPLLELNWLVNTTNGRTTTIGSEGRDLINFGGQASGSGLLTIALGGRVKITESAQLGAAFELPLAGKRDLFDYRFTLDFILRY
ncbi:hypothetical protein [Frigoriglobus tundricola]|uniref:Uncharacterized protein n=1 Tax=Frigoriglobus tundricola TaxID=2774151 RepID=A0A6M5Z189_9BACT|nr:hypothetical protein [Frigoriglobus tundricola]QJW99191.1 hypothetical protein FTUN_6791 [Frigoriglobus tundricola]